MSRSRKPLTNRRDAVFRAPELPRAMVRSTSLADAESAAGGQHRHEAVQLAVEPHLVEDLAAVALHAAVVVVELHARQCG